MTSLKLMLLSGLCVAGFLLASSVAAAPALSAESRYGAQFNEWFSRGDAAVSASTVFGQGVRLAAWDGQNENDASRVAVAAAVYFFQIPEGAVSVGIDVGYRADPAAQNPAVAGFLFVRNQAAERQYAPDGQEDQADEPAFVGDTYLLPANQTRQVVNVATADRVLNGVLEVHVAAGAGQVLDVQHVQATSFAAEMAPAPVFYMPSVNYVPDPYQYTYYYYYGGPCYYPYGGYFARFDCFDRVIDPFYWGGWSTFRACFSTHHRWARRPDHFAHGRPFAARPPIFEQDGVASHHQDWLRRNFRVDAGRFTDQQITQVARQRTHLVSSDQMRQIRDRARVVADEVQRSDRDLRTQLGNRFPGVIREWNRDRSQARRQFATLDSGRTIQSASAQWQALRAQPRAPFTPNLGETNAARRDSTPNPRALPQGTPWTGTNHQALPPTIRRNDGSRQDTPQPPANLPRVQWHFERLRDSANATPPTPSFTPSTPSTFPRVERRTDLTPAPRTYTPSILEGRFNPPAAVPSFPQSPRTLPSFDRRQDATPPIRSFTPSTPSTFPRVERRTDLTPAPRTYTPSTLEGRFNPPATTPSFPQTPRSQPSFDRRQDATPPIRSFTPPTFPRVERRTDLTPAPRSFTPPTPVAPTPRSFPTVERRFDNSRSVPSVEPRSRGADSGSRSNSFTPPTGRGSDGSGSWRGGRR